MLTLALQEPFVLACCNAIGHVLAMSVLQMSLSFFLTDEDLKIIFH